MTKTATKAVTKTGKKDTTPPAEPAARKPILGVDVKGELLDVPLDRVIDPAGTPDRMARPGDQAAIEQLARSMAECGQLQPAMLERLADGRFCRVFGRRRIAAASMLNWPTIRASVVPPLADDVRRTIVAIENVQRQDLTPAEETLAVDELMRLQAVPAAVQYARPIGPACHSWHGKIITPAIAQDILGAKPDARDANAHDLLMDHHVRGLAAELVAAMLGKPAQWVRDRLYIGRLSEKSKQLVLSGKLPLAHAREIAKIADEKRRDELCKDYAAGGADSISDDEAGPLEDLKSEVRKSVFALWVVPWKTDQAFAGKRPCEGCPHNSATNPGLFEGGGDVSLTMIGGRGTYDSAAADSAKVAGGGVCTLPSCYADKLRAAKAAISAAAKKIAEKKPGEASTVRVPPFVSPGALEKKVRERRSAGKSAPNKARPKSPAEVEADAKREALEQAREEHEEAMERHAEGLRKAIDKLLESDPVRAVLLGLIQESPMYDQATRYGPQAAKVAASAGFAALFDPLKKPVTIEAIATAVKGVAKGHKPYRVDTWNGAKSGATVVMARALGVDVGKVPTLEEFMPKAGKGEEATGSQGHRATSKPGKKMGAGCK